MLFVETKTMVYSSNKIKQNREGIKPSLRKQTNRQGKEVKEDEKIRIFKSLYYNDIRFADRMR